MDGNRRWLGWIAIGLGALALLVALGGRGLGPRGLAAGWNGATAPQAYAQRGVESQDIGPQRGRGAPGFDARRGAGRPGDGGFGLGGWFHFPFKLLGGLFQLGVLALLVLLGLSLIRGRSTAAAPGSAGAEPGPRSSPEPQEPSDESYPDEPRDRV